MFADVKAASATILLATIPPCLIARVFSAKLTKGSRPAGSPRTDDGFGAVEEPPVFLLQSMVLGIVLLERRPCFLLDRNET